MNQNHGYTTSPPVDPSKPSHAERARTLLAMGGVSSLATNSKKHPGFPFASVMPYAIQPDGSPIFLISSMAVHTKNLESDPHATLLVIQGDGSDLLGAGRLSVMGTVRVVGDEQLADTREIYLAAHPNAANYIDFADFRLFQLTIADIYFVGGFGVMGWVGGSEFSASEADPLAPHANSIMEHMNQDHQDALILLAANEMGGTIEAAKMISVDRYGFNVRVKRADGFEGGRVMFTRTVDMVDEVRELLIEMIQQVRES